MFRSFLRTIRSASARFGTCGFGTIKYYYYVLEVRYIARLTRRRRLNVTQRIEPRTATLVE